MRRRVHKIVVANRGEIAVRVMRACREMGLRSVAIYSEADRDSLHVRYADEAQPVGPAPAAESYLNVERILEAARRSGAEAIHPGYGFLAENPRFAAACKGAGLLFVGPSPEAMEAMGSKTRSRKIAAAAGVPVVPGSMDAVLDEADAARRSAEIGYPVMVKASAGGGGKGMRLVAGPADLPSALRAARSEALSSFGDGSVYLEKALERPRHVEVQVLGDEHGALVWLGERECSIQRRHQKVVEEAPSPALDEEGRNRLGEAAVSVARSAGYTNAGTVEFLLEESGDFYFLEMNARLQVEHPVTEMVLGVDLVKAQLRIAMGEALAISQSEVRVRGHAIECRIYAEDPDNAFLPCPGVIRRLDLPGGPGVRNDVGVYEGATVPVHYDPMLGKLVVWAADREEAVRRAARALEEYRVLGVRTTIPFLLRVMADDGFRSGRFDTSHADALLSGPPPPVPEGEARAAVLGVLLERARRTRGAAIPGGRRGSAWRLSGRREGTGLA